MKTLNVKKISGYAISKEWAAFFLPAGLYYYVRCNAKGIINWEKTAVYSAHELVGRDNVKILK